MRVRVRIRPVLALATVGVALSAAAGTARAEGDADDFRANCTSCHTIGGGRIVGPDLKDVTTRQRREWLVRFLQDPKAAIDAGDPYATKLFSEARGILMPTLQGMSPKRAGLLLDLIEAESKLEKSQFAASGVSERPFTAADIQAGRELFLGRRALAGGGTACVSCHSAGDLGGLGGGRLGPDLSDVYARLAGRKALGAWLMAPPTATMKPQFAGKALDPEKEILPLLAFLKDVDDRHAVPMASAERLTFLLVSVAAAAAFLLLLDRAWGRRFRGVRSALVKGRS